ncbi:MAG: hypothetical protein SCH66_14950 [Methanolobus sp.]|nr:hypothetical protein [Methanolobus sp.]
MRYTRKEVQDISDELGQPIIVVEEKEGKGLTLEQKKHLEETKRRHDKAFRRLARM